MFGTPWEKMELEIKVERGTTILIIWRNRSNTTAQDMHKSHELRATLVEYIGTNSVMPNHSDFGFCIRTREKNLQFAVQSEYDRDDWLTVVNNAVYNPTSFEEQESSPPRAPSPEYPPIPHPAHEYRSSSEEKADIEISEDRDPPMALFEDEEAIRKLQRLEDEITKDLSNTVRREQEIQTRCSELRAELRQHMDRLRAVVSQAEAQMRQNLANAEQAKLDELRAYRTNLERKYNEVDAGERKCRELQKEQTRENMDIISDKIQKQANGFVAMQERENDEMPRMNFARDFAVGKIDPTQKQEVIRAIRRLGEGGRAGRRYARDSSHSPPSRRREEDFIFGM